MIYLQKHLITPSRFHFTGNVSYLKDVFLCIIIPSKHKSSEKNHFNSMVTPFMCVPGLSLIFIFVLMQRMINVIFIVKFDFLHSVISASSIWHIMMLWTTSVLKFLPPTANISIQNSTWVSYFAAWSYTLNDIGNYAFGAWSNNYS